MSPGYFATVGAMARGFILDSGGLINGTNWITGNSGVRPVINLNANVEITGGIGTKSEPYIVKTT